MKTANKFQVFQTYIADINGVEKKAWNVVDTQDNFVVELFTTKYDAVHYASKWSKIHQQLKQL